MGINSWLRGAASRVFGLPADERQSFGLTVAISSEMAKAIDRWYEEYCGRAPWLQHSQQSLKLPAVVAAEMATLVTLEADIKIKGSPRADWLMAQFAPVIKNLQTNVEYACAFGGLVMKTCVDDEGIAIDYVMASDFYPTAFNSRNEITGAAFIDRKRIARATYNRLEHHSLIGKRYTITNRCFKAYGDTDRGVEVPLTEVDEWKDIQPVVTIENMEKPLFAYFRIPLGNTIDPKSPLGVSVYAKAESNMEEADKQYQRLLWEYEGGELAIDASEDVFELDRSGKAILPVGKERLYRTNQTDPKLGGDAVFKTFAPQLRDEAFARGIDKILHNIENQTGLAHGTLAEQQVEVRTATEIKASKQRTYATVKAIQGSLQDAIESLVYAMDTTATLYNLFPAGKYEVICKWDDSIITDSETERVRNMQEVREGLMQKYEYRMKWNGEDEATAKRMVDDGMTDDEILFGNSKNNPSVGDKEKKDE